MKYIQEKKYLNEKSLAAYLDISHHTLKYWRKTGKGPDFFKLPNGGVRYSFNSVNDYCNKFIKNGLSR